MFTSSEKIASLSSSSIRFGCSAALVLVAPRSSGSIAWFSTIEGAC